MPAMLDRHAHVHRLVAGLLLAATLVVGGCGAQGQQPTAPPVTQPAALALEVSVAQAAALRDQGAFVLDVREPDEWAAGHIEGATLIPLGQLAGRVGEVPRDRTVVVVCHSGNRSAQGRDILRQAGFTNVTSMAGGMSAWTAAGQPVVQGS
jgi:rhodanese-related sulfurtransferase